MIRTVVADDEPLAREAMRKRLLREPDFELVGEACDGPGTLDIVAREQPELLFLDVKMPGLEGFSVLEKIPENFQPLVVFVTAFSDHALEAFDVGATDYLLKPISNKRWSAALGRVRQTLEREQFLDTRRQQSESVEERPYAIPTSAQSPTFLAVRGSDGYVLLTPGEIDWIEAARNYVRLHSERGVFLLRATMTSMEKRLAEAGFARIHRSLIVNVSKIATIRPEWHGDFQVELRDSTILRMSRRYSAPLLKPDGGSP